MHCYAVEMRDDAPEDDTGGQLLVFENDPGCRRGDRYARERELENPALTHFTFEEATRIAEAVRVEEERHDLRLLVRVSGSAMGATATEAERRFIDGLRSFAEHAARRKRAAVAVDGIEPA